MSSDVISVLHIDKLFPLGHVIVLKEINGCDSTFITSCIIGHQIKRKSYIILVTLHNSMSHYQNVGLKMNYNLKKSVDSGSVDVYNPAEDIINSFITSDEKICLNEVITKIEEKITKAKATHDHVTVILDGVSHLLDLNFNLQAVNSFLRKLIRIMRIQKDSLLLLHCSVASENDITQTVSNLLSHMAYTVVELANLPTGRSADVSGHLTVKHPGSKFEAENLYIMDTRPSQYHFKLFDRGIKLFAPGSLY